MKVARNISISLLMIISVYVLLICALGLEIPFGAIVIFGVLVFCTLLLVILSKYKK